MNKLFIVFILMTFLFVSNCDWVAPDTMKAKIEREQLELSEDLLKDEISLFQERNRLLKEQNKQLKRIADALEKGVRGW